MDDVTLQEFMVNMTGAVKVLGDKLTALTGEVNDLRGLVNMKIMGNVEVVEKPVYVESSQKPAPLDLTPIMIMVNTLSDTIQSKHAVLTESISALHEVPPVVPAAAPSVDLTSIERAFGQVRGDLQDFRNLLSSLTLPAPIVTVEPTPVEVNVSPILDLLIKMDEKIKDLTSRLSCLDMKPEITVQASPVEFKGPDYTEHLGRLSKAIMSVLDKVQSLCMTQPAVTDLDNIASAIDIMSRNLQIGIDHILEQQQWSVQKVDTPSAPIQPDVIVVGTEITVDIQDNVTAEVEDATEPNV